MARPLAFLAALATLAVLVVSATTADAADSSCSSGDFCVYSGYAWSGSRYTDPGDNYSYYGENYPGTSVALDDSASTVYNHGNSHKVRMFEYEGYGGKKACLLVGSWRTWTFWQPDDNILSSHYWTSSSSGCV